MNPKRNQYLISNSHIIWVATLYCENGSTLYFTVTQNYHYTKLLVFHIYNKYKNLPKEYASKAQPLGCYRSRLDTCLLLKTQFSSILCFPTRVIAYYFLQFCSLTYLSRTCFILRTAIQTE